MIYIAAPYTNPADPSDRRYRQDKYAQIAELTARLLAQGHIVYSPIAANHNLACDYGLPKGWDFWEKIDFAMLDLCEEVWVIKMAGWNQSRGVKAEIARAKAKKIPVKELTPDEALSLGA